MILAILLAMFGQTYEQGLAKASSAHTPLVVVVTASWCEPCKLLKDDIESMRKGELRDAVIVFVDVDERPDLAKQLMDGTTVPQVVMFHQSRTGIWKRVRAVGRQTKDRVLEMLRKVVR
jgi:thioredoxin-like negative regulator of GroEL